MHPGGIHVLNLTTEAQEVLLPNQPMRLILSKSVNLKKKKKRLGTSLVVQWLRLHAASAEDPSLIAGQGTRSHMLKPKILHAATKNRQSQINKYFKKLNVKKDSDILGLHHTDGCTIL